MFPIPFNFPFRKKDGSITTMDDAISSGGGSYTLPTASASTKGGVKIGNGLTMTGEVLSANAQVPVYSESESGKVLTVNASGELEWDVKGSGGGNIYTDIVRGIFIKSNNKYNIGATSTSMMFTMRDNWWSYMINTDNEYNLSDVIILDDISPIEYLGYIDNDISTALGLVELFTSLNNVSSGVISDDLDKYKALVIMAVYSSELTSQYNTTVFYNNPQLNTPYWFGVKDRNTSYCGNITFSDKTHFSVKDGYNLNDISRQLRMWGIAK